MVDERPILGYMAAQANSVFFYDLKTKKAFPVIKTNLPDLGQNTYAIPYKDSRSLRAIFPMNNKFAIADVEKGKILFSIDFPLDVEGHEGRPLHVTESQGRPIAYTSLRDEIIIIDLKTKNITRIDTKPITGDLTIQGNIFTQNLTEFELRGEKYLVWGGEFGVGILSLSSMSVISNKVGNAIYQVLPFEQEGRIMAPPHRPKKSPAYRRSASGSVKVKEKFSPLSGQFPRSFRVHRHVIRKFLTSTPPIHGVSPMMGLPYESKLGSDLMSAAREKLNF